MPRDNDEAGNEPHENSGNRMFMRFTSQPRFSNMDLTRSVISISFSSLKMQGSTSASR